MNDKTKKLREKRAITLAIIILPFIIIISIWAIRDANISFFDKALPLVTFYVLIIWLYISGKIKDKKN